MQELIPSGRSFSCKTPPLAANSAALSVTCNLRCECAPRRMTSAFSRCRTYREYKVRVPISGSLSGRNPQKLRRYRGPILFVPRVSYLTIDLESRKWNDDETGIAAIQRRCRAGSRHRCVDEGAYRRIGSHRAAVV